MSLPRVDAETHGTMRGSCWSRQASIRLALAKRAAGHFLYGAGTDSTEGGGEQRTGRLLRPIGYLSIKQSKLINNVLLPGVQVDMLKQPALLLPLAWQAPLWAQLLSPSAQGSSALFLLCQLVPAAP